MYSPKIASCINLQLTIEIFKNRLFQTCVIVKRTCISIFTKIGLVDQSKPCTQMYGIMGNVLELCTSYLKNRTPFVVYDGVKSYTKSIDCGVPQGSILGPLFFILFMNDIFHASQSLFNILYADDTSIFLSLTLTSLSEN